jgi:hypothetical protein
MTELEKALSFWRKSATSATENCVEVAILSDAVFVRDSKDREGPVLSASRENWFAFIRMLQR